jgi:hypothetical protein
MPDHHTGMDTSNLTQAQLVALGKHINAAVRATQSIVNRMQELKFPKDDPLYEAVWKNELNERIKRDRSQTCPV